MTNRHETARLSDYLDDELTIGERAAVEAHLADCPECASTLDELRTVVREAGRLPGVPPEHDLWPGIEARLTPRGAGTAEGPGSVDPRVVPMAPRRRVVMTVPQLIAAAIALVLFSTGGVWLAIGGVGRPGSMGPVVATPQSAPATLVTFTEFDRTMVALEQEYRSRRSELDPETIRVVERNLAIIDQAIGEARDALASDPSSGFLSEHLASAMRQKMDLLRRAATISRTET